ncbi:major facilitator superfamily domain-containing protein [Gymnopilus junonius]|uniref:Major facilitator superfamily domain-containing protein n=1 Tax=Gymnopilus junonius TaxID=109634 RepID=A0A9P5NHC7_GYMJU|nr:major facilitator superfamily domain-containing protein [Gymnopilus junonius]
MANNSNGLEITSRLDSPAISPLLHARMSDYATTVMISRHQIPSSLPPSESNYSPYSSSPSTAVNSRAPSPTKEFDRDVDDLVIGQDRLKWRLASGFFALFVGGWADGVTGTVMPYLTAQFHLDSTLSSSLFAATTCGYFAGTFIVEVLMKYLGRLDLSHHGSQSLFYPFISLVTSKPLHKDKFGHSESQARYILLVFASLTHASYFIMMGSRSGFPVMFLAYVLSAFSRALLTAPLNAYFATGPKQALGYGLGLASLGSVISPLVCQSIIASGVPWYRFYYGSLVLSGFNVIFLCITFKPTFNEATKEHQKALDESRRQKSLLLRSGRSSPANEYPPTPAVSTVQFDLASKPQSVLRRVLAMPYQWAISFFILLYCGSETATQGFDWQMVTFLLSTRYANSKTIGYVTSGFWAGISIGLASLSGNTRSMHACLAVVTHLTIFLVKSNIENAVATSLIGVLYGPVFPACLSMANDILPADVHMVAMSLISSFSSLGGAIFPLVAGAIFDSRGIQTLPYLNIPLAAAMACLWTFFPSRQPDRRGF